MKRARHRLGMVNKLVAGVMLMSLFFVQLNIPENNTVYAEEAQEHTEEELLLQQSLSEEEIEAEEGAEEKAEEQEASEGAEEVSEMPGEETDEENGAHEEAPSEEGTKKDGIEEETDADADEDSDDDEAGETEVEEAEEEEAEAEAIELTAMVLGAKRAPKMIPPSRLSAGHALTVETGKPSTDYSDVNTFTVKTTGDDFNQLVSQSGETASISWDYNNSLGDYFDINKARNSDGEETISFTPRNNLYINHDITITISVSVQWSDGLTESYSPVTHMVYADDGAPAITSVTLDSTDGTAEKITSGQIGTISTTPTGILRVNASDTGSCQSGIKSVEVYYIDPAGESKSLTMHHVSGDEYTISAFLLNQCKITDIVAADNSSDASGSHKETSFGTIEITVDDGTTHGNIFEDYTLTGSGWTNSKSEQDAGDVKWFSKPLHGNSLQLTANSRKLTLLEDLTDSEIALYRMSPVKAASPIVPTVTDIPGRRKRADFIIPVGEDGEYYYAMNYEYKKGFVKQTIAMTQTVRLNVDSTEPTIAVDYGHIEPINSESVYSNRPVTITVDFDDIHLCVDKGGYKPTYIKLVNAEDGSSTVIDSGASTFAAKWTPKSDGGCILSFTVDSDGDYYIEAYAEDLAGNQQEYNKGNNLNKRFIIDTTEPEVRIEFDNDDAVYGNFFNTERTATVYVTDKNFDASGVTIEVTAEDIDGNTDTLTTERGNWIHNAEEHSITVKFTLDGKYQIRAAATDLAGNVSKDAESGEFIIDRTGPEITLYFDNNNVKNNIYYKDARTATISIKDFGLNERTVAVTTSAEEGTTPTPGRSAFEGEGTTKTATIAFNEDGRYAFTIQCDDYAGNKSAVYTVGAFVIDGTEPEIRFDHVGNHSANKGDVAPAVIYRDKNIAEETCAVIITGANRGDVTMRYDEEDGIDGVVWSFHNIPKERKYDDLYTLTATVTDLAGNTTTQSLIYSVNRFGSVYVIDEATREMMEQDYVKEPVSVKITEINVDTLVRKDVTVSRDGEAQQLKAGLDYTLRSQGNDETWKSFTYTVPKDYFTNDGYYAVTIASVDRATNAQDNRSRNAAIDFKLDRTPPSIVAAGIKTGATYEDDIHIVTVNVTDNMALKDLTVYDDNALVEAFDSEQLRKNNGTQEIELAAKENAREIRMIATDEAGNEQEIAFNNIRITEVTAAEIEEEAVPLEPAPEPVQNGLPWWLLLIVVAAAAGGYFYYRSRKNEKGSH